jgi:hypothetical protein
MSDETKIILKNSKTPISALSIENLFRKIDSISRQVGPVKVINNYNQTGTKIIFDVKIDKDGFILYQSGDNKWEFLDDDDEIFY